MTTNSIPKSLADYWENQKSKQKIKPSTSMKMKIENKKTDKELLDNIDIEVIERYLRNKKLEKIKNLI